jgi:hypothetical protein
MGEAVAAVAPMIANAALILFAEKPLDMVSSTETVS